MIDRHDEPSQNPYRSPAGIDDGLGGTSRRQRTRDLALAGLFLGVAYGAATGAAITVGLYAFECLIWLARSTKSFTDIHRLGVWVWLIVAIAVVGAILGAFSGAVLGPLQGVMTAQSTAPARPRLVRLAAFVWAIVAAIWTLLIDQSMLSSADHRWMFFVALLAAPLAGGVGGAIVASKLARTETG